MSRFERTGLRTILCVAAAAALAGAALAGPASADDGDEPSVADVVETAAAIADGATATVTEDVLEDVAPALDEPTPGDVPPTASEPAASDAPVGGGDAHEASNPASQATSASDTTADSGDTAGGSTTQPSSGMSTHPSADPAPGAVAAPRVDGGAAAINVNVSVRIGSPGDNGAVTQENASAGTTPARPDTTGASKDTGAAPASSSTPAEPDEEWYWQWDCLSMPNVPVVSPTGSSSDSFPRNWTWIWNCGENHPQYQDNSSQYQQINANIAIRISSPGDNGPVSQKNVSITAGVSGGGTSAPVAHIGSPLAAISAPPAPTVRVDIAVGVSAAIDVPDVLSGIATVDEATAVGVVDVGVDTAVAGALIRGTLTLTPLGGDLPTGVPPYRAGLPRIGHRVGAAAQWQVTNSSAASGTTTRIRPVGGPADDEDPAGSGARPARRVPADDVPTPRAPAPSPAGTSASAAGAGGSSGGGLPIYIALPFLAALLDLARRVALERATWPTGHGRRIPDTPG